MRMLQRLSAVKVAKLREAGRYSDGGGLYLQVSSFGTKAWTFRYQINGRPRLMGLGALHTVTLAEARDTARECRKLIRTGIDPIEVKREKRLQAALEGARGVTFKDAAERYIEAHKASWRNPVHAAQWPATLSAYAYPVIGHLSVAAIDTGLVSKVLSPIWSEKPETASRVRGRIEAVLDYASVHGYRQGENPARWRGHLDKILPKRSKVRKVQHHRALPYAELGAFMVDLRKQEGIAPRALEFTILTCARTGEAIRAKWPEIDVSKKLWTVPGARMKGGRDHRVPLSDAAVALLKALPHEKGSDWVFIGGKSGKPLSNMAMLELMRGMGIAAVPHGFRSTFRDWAAEQTNYPHELAEMALAHVVSDKVEAAYRRGDMFEKRRRLASAWAAYCGTASRGGDVVPIGKGRK
jgi:integrase